jgi:hypothetical protein
VQLAGKSATICRLCDQQINWGCFVLRRDLGRAEGSSLWRSLVMVVGGGTIDQ